MRTLFAKLVSPGAFSCLLPLVAIGIAACSAKAPRFSEDGYASRPASGQVAAAPGLSPMARAANGVPKLDVDPSCEAAAQGSVVQGRDKQACLDDENRAKEQAIQNWSQYRDADKQQCVELIREGGPPSYVELLTCLEAMRDASTMGFEELGVPLDVTTPVISPGAAGGRLPNNFRNCEEPIVPRFCPP
jgi:hypothetical protein